MDNITAALAADIVESYGPAVQANLRTKNFFSQKKLFSVHIPSEKCHKPSFSLFWPIFCHSCAATLFGKKSAKGGGGGGGIAEQSW